MDPCDTCIHTPPKSVGGYCAGCDPSDPKYSLYEERQHQTGRKPDMDLKETVAAAKEEGLSYGQYVLRHETREEQTENAPAEQPTSGTFWERYTELCEKAGKSPSKAAIEIGLSSGMPSHWKKGNLPTPENAEKLAEYFGVTTAWLLTGRDPEGKDPAVQFTHSEPEEASAPEEEAPDTLCPVNPEHDPVNHPDHYTQGGIECKDAIKAAVTALGGYEGFLTGNAIKYLWRWKLKNGAEDLRKAAFWIQELVDETEACDGTE